MANENEIEVKAAPEKQNVLILNPEAEAQGLSSLSQNTIARIVLKTTLAVEGVARFAPKGAGDIFSIFSSKAFDSSMGIEFADGKINLTLALFLYYGVEIPKVIAEVRSKLIDALTSMTGAQIGKISILIKDLVEPEEPEAAEEASDVVLDSEVEK